MSMLNFDLPKNQSSIIKVIGVGGGGSNAVTHMFHQGIKGVDFIICNTDAQAMEASPVPIKIPLGENLTGGLGAGAVPSVGKNAALENREDIKAILERNTRMLFITAGLGGGTGTGAAPVIASVAKELGILTVAIVTMPFSFEGRKRRQHADEGIAELKRHVDAVLIINNDKLRELYGNLTLRAAFGHADDVLTTAARGIAELITVTGHINVDFEDVKTVMKDSGVAIMGVGIASGERRAAIAIEQAMCSPLLNDDNVEGANNILLYISSGKEEITMDEVSEITEYIQEKTGPYTEVIWGNGIDDSLEDKISVTVIATGFDKEHTRMAKPEAKPNRIIHTLDGKATPVIEEPATLPLSEPKMEVKIKPVAPLYTPTEPKMVEPTIVAPPTPDPEPSLFDSVSVETPEITSENEESLQLNDEEDFETTEETQEVTFELAPEPNATSETLEEEAFIFESAEESSFTSQRTLEFELTELTQPSPEPLFEGHDRSGDNILSEKYQVEELSYNTVVAENMMQVQEEDQLSEMDRLQRDRKDKLKNLSVKLKVHTGNLENDLHDIETIPAYKRRNVNLSDSTPSFENQAVKYSISGNGEEKTAPLNENQFLHNKPD